MDRAEEVFMYCRHSDYWDDHIIEESMCNIHRCKELQACTSETFKSCIKNKIELVNPRDALFGTNEFQDHLKVIAIRCGSEISSIPASAPLSRKRSENRRKDLHLHPNFGILNILLEGVVCVERIRVSNQHNGALPPGLA